MHGFACRRQHEMRKEVLTNYNRFTPSLPTQKGTFLRKISREGTGISIALQNKAPCIVPLLFGCSFLLASGSDCCALVLSIVPWIGAGTCLFLPSISLIGVCKMHFPIFPYHLRKTKIHSASFFFGLFFWLSLFSCSSSQFSSITHSN